MLVFDHRKPNSLVRPKSLQRDTSSRNAICLNLKAGLPSVHMDTFWPIKEYTSEELEGRGIEKLLLVIASHVVRMDLWLQVSK